MQNDKTDDENGPDEPGDKLGCFGRGLAAHFHLNEGKSKQSTSLWRGQDVFAVTRLRSDAGIPDLTTSVSEPALNVSIAIEPVPLRCYELWIDSKPINVPHIPAYHTSVMDLQSDPVCWVGTGFDYVHFYVPRAMLNDIACDHGIKPVGNYKFSICENDLVLATLARLILPHIGSSDWTGSLTLDQFGLVIGAHVLQTYAGLRRIREPARGGRGLALWQEKRATEMLREHLDGNIRLADLARECELSVSHFARSFKASFGMSARQWLVERRIEWAKGLLIASNLPLADIALQSGFSDQATFTRTFHQAVGDSPGRWRRHRMRRSYRK